MIRIKFLSCPTLLHVAKFYTPPLFDLFHKEFDISLGCKVKEMKEFGDKIRCVIQKRGAEKEYVVFGNVKLDASGAKTLGGVSCGCRKFENSGILCGHACNQSALANECHGNTRGIHIIPVEARCKKWFT